MKAPKGDQFLPNISTDELEVLLKKETDQKVVDRLSAYVARRNNNSISAIGKSLSIPSSTIYGWLARAEDWLDRIRNTSGTVPADAEGGANDDNGDAVRPEQFTNPVQQPAYVDEKRRSLAMLFDGDNISPKAVKDIIDEASRHGYLRIRRVYGDWANPNMASWKEAANLNAILPIQQFNISGKNSTDGALIIDAMDMLYADKVDGFCIVSSDSDYTRLALKLREHGKFVLGIGERKTHQSLVKACHRFTHIDTIAPDSVRSNAKAPPLRIPGGRTKWVDLAKKAVDESSGENEWALLTDVGNRLRILDPAFDQRTYGFEKLSMLFKSEPNRFELKDNTVGGVFSGHLVRLKPGK